MLKNWLSHWEVLRLIEIDLHFATRSAAEVQDADDKQNLYVLYFKLVCIIILINKCGNFN
jgi:hypothetical protein